MTSRQRQAALRARRKDQGLVRVEVWVPAELRYLVQGWVKAMVKKAQGK